MVDRTRIRLDRTRNWREFLLEEPLDAELAARLPEFLKATAQNFLAGFRPDTTTAEADALNRWYASSTGQATLAAFTRELWTQMESVAGNAMPAHDARHAMYKVPATSLDYVAAGNVVGWERVGVLGALLHDYGRWAEERIFGFPGISVLHARLSFLLGQELLETFEMPPRLKQHILLAAIRHSSGAEPADPMPLKLTVAADRDQLYGPEIVLRLVHHAVGPQGALSCFYGERPGRTVLAHLGHFLVHRLPGPLFSRESAVHRLWLILATFLLIAEAPAASRERFSRVTTLPYVGESNPARAFDAAEAQRNVADCPVEALSALLSAPHVAPAQVYRQEALGKLAGISADNRPRLASALHYVNASRIALDAEQFLSLEGIRRANSDDQMVSTLAGLLLKGWHGSPPQPQPPQPPPSLSRAPPLRQSEPGEDALRGSSLPLARVPRCRRR